MPVVMTTWHKVLQEEKERARARKFEVKLAAERQKELLTTGTEPAAREHGVQHAVVRPDRPASAFSASRVALLLREATNRPRSDKCNACKDSNSGEHTCSRRLALLSHVRQTYLPCTIGKCRL